MPRRAAPPLQVEANWNPLSGVRAACCPWTHCTGLTLAAASCSMPCKVSKASGAPCLQHSCVDHYAHAKNMAETKAMSSGMCRKTRQQPLNSPFKACYGSQHPPARPSAIKLVRTALQAENTAPLCSTKTIIMVAATGAVSVARQQSLHRFMLSRPYTGHARQHIWVPIGSLTARHPLGRVRHTSTRCLSTTWATKQSVVKAYPPSTTLANPHNLRRVSSYQHLGCVSELSRLSFTSVPWQA